jgi:hypothetical protein
MWNCAKCGESMFEDEKVWENVRKAEKVWSRQCAKSTCELKL